jgi:spoIIIJ-associated protein
LVDAEEAIDIALEELSHFLCVDVGWVVEETEDGFKVELEGPDKEWLLDDDGSLLLAIEHLLPRMVRSLSGEGAHCSVDCDGFHSSHEDHLCEMAVRAAEETIRSGRPQMLEPMAPADRRVVHLHLVNDPTVGTQSKGNGLFKRVKIFPARPA